MGQVSATLGGFSRSAAGTPRRQNAPYNALPGPRGRSDASRLPHPVSEPLPVLRSEGQHGAFRVLGVPDDDRPVDGSDLDAVAAGAAAVT